MSPEAPLSSDNVIGRLSESLDAALRNLINDVKEQASASSDPLQQRRLATIRQLSGDQRADLVATFQREFAKQAAQMEKQMATHKATSASQLASGNMTIKSDDDNRVGLITQELATDINARINDELRLIGNRLFELGGKRVPIVAGITLEAEGLCSVLTQTLKKYQVDYDTQRLFYRMLSHYLPNLVEEALLDLLKRLTIAPEPGLKQAVAVATDSADDLFMQIEAELARRSMPEAIGQFLNTHRQVLAAIVFNIREDDRMGFVSLLLSTLDASNWEHKRDRNKQILPGVLKRLQENAQAAALPAEEWEAFYAALSKWHTLLIKLTSKRAKPG